MLKQCQGTKLFKKKKKVLQIIKIASDQSLYFLILTDVG